MVLAPIQMVTSGHRSHDAGDVDAEARRWEQSAVSVDRDHD